MAVSELFNMASSKTLAQFNHGSSKIQGLAKRFPLRYIAGSRSLWRFSELDLLTRRMLDIKSAGKITGEGQIYVPAKSFSN